MRVGFDGWPSRHDQILPKETDRGLADGGVLVHPGSSFGVFGERRF